jgi:hypothetical protein
MIIRWSVVRGLVNTLPILTGCRFSSLAFGDDATINGQESMCQMTFGQKKGMVELRSLWYKASRAIRVIFDYLLE